MPGPAANLHASYADDAEVLVVVGMHAVGWKDERCVVVADQQRKNHAGGRACIATIASPADALAMAASLAERDARVYVRTIGGAWAEIVAVEIVGAEVRRKQNARSGLNYVKRRGPALA